MNEHRMDREFSDYKKIGLHLNQLVGSSSSIGARRVRNVCVAFRSASELNNRPGYTLLPFFFEHDTLLFYGVHITYKNRYIMTSFLRKISCMKLQVLERAGSSRA